MLTESEVRLLYAEQQGILDRLQSVKGSETAKEFYRTRAELLNFILTGELITDPRQREEQQKTLEG